MKGPFSMWGLFGLTFWIDIITILAVRKQMRSSTRASIYNPVHEVSVIIPAYKEDEFIWQTIYSLADESYPVKNIVVVGDRYSKKMEKMVRMISDGTQNLIYLNCPERSKSQKINYAVKELNSQLGEFIYVRDARVRGKKDCIEKMVSYFTMDKVAAVTSFGRLSEPRNLLSKAYYYGKAWINEMGRFRKLSQEKRNALFVICGASTMYRKSVLEKFPIPCCTKTEDTLYTWQLQMKGYVIRVADDAIVSAPELDGPMVAGLVSQLQQSYRWSSGTMQCLYYEGRNLFRNKNLIYTTILPGFLEAITYSVPLVILPLFIFAYPRFLLLFIAGDTLFSLLSTLIILPKKFLKTVAHYPQIVFFKYMNALMFVSAVVAVSLQAVTGRTSKWNNRWYPPQTGRG